MTAAVVLLISGPAGAQEDEVSPPEVAPTVVERPAPVAQPAPRPAAQVEGVVQTQPLPRTGGDFGPEVLAGLALTGAGVALAAGARRRRSQASAA